MSSIMAAAAMGALMTGAGSSHMPARAAISPQERTGAIQTYRIPAGSMAAALNVIADENDLHVLYDARLTDGLRTPGLSGAYSVRDALGALLVGTRLTYEFSRDGHSVSIVLAQADNGVRNDAGGAEALPTIEIGAAETAATRPGRRGEPKTPAEGYVVQSATTALKTDVPLKQTPLSVSVVPTQVIRDQAITSLQGAVENVSGVRTNADAISGYNFKIRGFDSFDIYRNNLPTGDARFVGADMANVERIEVLKGPASVLYGRAEPGGIVNVVTKQPLDQPRYVVEQQFGSFAHYRTQWDFNSPVTEIPGLAWRVSGAYQDTRVFRDIDHSSRINIAPTVSWRPSDWTEFTVDLQYSGNIVSTPNGLVAVGSQVAPLPITRTFQERNDPYGRTAVFFGGYKFRQNLNEDWKITNRFSYASLWYDQNFMSSTALQGDNMTLTRTAQRQNIRADTYSTNIDLEGKFTTIGAKHIFLFGLDYTNNYRDYYFALGGTSFPINIYNPIYGMVPSWAYEDATNGSGRKSHTSQLRRQKGFYVQDHVTFLDDRLHLLFGVRYDIADVVTGRSNNRFVGDYSPTEDAAIQARLGATPAKDTGWSPRVGAVYDLTPEVSVYGNFSRSFGANSTTATQVFPPQRGTQWEVGFKAQVLTDLSATLAFYQLTKSNITTPDLATPDPTDRKLAGLQRSRGIELDILGRVTERLSVVANYAHTDAKVIADNLRDPLNPIGSGLLYNHLDDAPRHSGRIFLTYDFGEGGLGWRIGGGVSASTRMWGDIQNTFMLPGWARLDGFASYTTVFEGHKLTAQLNLRNITNTHYYDGANFGFTAPPRLDISAAQPFTAVGTLKFEW